MIPQKCRALAQPVVGLLTNDWNLGLERQKREPWEIIIVTMEKRQAIATQAITV